jgi:molybdopterin-guanine dinucleotide biosynthesis protein A
LLFTGLDDYETSFTPGFHMLSLVIQAGGESRRIGSDKALLPFLGQPLILRPLSRLATIADEVLVTSNHPERFSFLGLSPLSDLFPGCGALGGLYTALSIASHPYVAVVACDMPFASAKLFAYELLVLREADADGVVPHPGEGIEPFHAIYKRETCLPHALAALRAEKRRVDSWFNEVNIYYLNPDDIQPYDPDGLAFLNVNTIEELEAAERIASHLATEDGLHRQK